MKWRRAAIASSFESVNSSVTAIRKAREAAEEAEVEVTVFKARKAKADQLVRQTEAEEPANAERAAVEQLPALALAVETAVREADERVSATWRAYAQALQ